MNSDQCDRQAWKRVMAAYNAFCKAPTQGRQDEVMRVIEVCRVLYGDPNGAVPEGVMTAGGLPVGTDCDHRGYPDYWCDLCKPK